MTDLRRDSFDNTEKSGDDVYSSTSLQKDMMF